MAVQYQLWLLTDDGATIAPLPEYDRFSYHLGYCRVNPFTGLFRAQFPQEYLKPDRLIAVYRREDSGPLALMNVFMLRKWAIQQDQDGRINTILQGLDMNHLLARRVVAYLRGNERSFQANENIDDIMKLVVRQNLGDAATLNYDGTANDQTFRSLTGYGFGVAGYSGEGALISAEYPWKNTLLDLLKDLHDISRLEGPIIYFGVLARGVGTYQFQTFANQPGADRTQGQEAIPPFNVSFGNMANPSLTYDYSQEASFAYALGLGSGEGRRIGTALDNQRLYQSIWGRIETTVDARTASGPTYLDFIASQELGRRKVLVTLEADLFSTGRVPFSVAWNVGDRVPIQFMDQVYSAVVESASISYDSDGKETIQAKVQAQVSSE